MLADQTLAAVTSRLNMKACRTCFDYPTGWLSFRVTSRDHAARGCVADRARPSASNASTIHWHGSIDESLSPASAQGVPARPLNMTAIEATNRGRADMAWAMLTSSPEVREVSLDEVRGRPSDAVVLDVREPEEFANGHVPGAVNLPQADLATRLDEVPRDRPVFVICQGGFRSLRAAQFLRQQGISDVASVKGGTEAWRAAGGEIIIGERSCSAARHRRDGMDPCRWRQLLNLGLRE